MKSILKKRSSNDSSDSDDWTLLSAPHTSISSSSSASSTSSDPPQNVITFETLSRGRSTCSNLPSSSSSPKLNLDDGLTEIDLNNDNNTLLSLTTSNLNQRQQDSSEIDNKRLEKKPSPEPGFTAIDTTDDEGDVDDHDDIVVDNNAKDDDEEWEDQASSSSRSSGSHELINFAAIDELMTKAQECREAEENSMATIADEVVTQEDVTADTQGTPHSRPTFHYNYTIRPSPNESTSKCFYCFIATMLLLALYLKIFGPDYELGRVTMTFKFDSPLWSKNHTNTLTDVNQLNELELLHDELSQCIRRQSPTSFKYYMSENQQHSTEQQTCTESESSQKCKSTSTSTSNTKPNRGLVCYGQESQWRKRFDRLKSEFNLDLVSLVQETKRNFTNSIIQSKHPTIQFTLILDQLEYLQYLENKRNKKLAEETIKHLKADNLQLLRRLNQPNGNNHQKYVVNLELKNSRLERENEALKANLMKKAGTVYMKQSMELEQFERENIMLKHFYIQVAQDVSKSLKQFNLHAIDATQPLDDHEILNSQLMLTRGYLRKLGEKISSVLLENESLKEELRETYMNAVLSKGTNLQTASSTADGHISDNFSAIGTGASNESNSLIADSCIRSLMESRRRSQELERELSTLQDKCSHCNPIVDIEKVDKHNRLNRTGRQLDGSIDQTKRISHSSTAMDKRHRDSLYQANEEIVDGLITFLTKFNHQVETNNFPIIGASEDDGSMLAQDHGTGSESLSPITSDEGSEMKIIPNYIREEMRSRLSGKTTVHSGDTLKSDGEGLPIGFNHDLFNATTATSSSSHNVNLSDDIPDEHEAVGNNESLCNQETDESGTIPSLEMTKTSTQELAEGGEESQKINPSEPVLEEPEKSPSGSSSTSSSSGNSWVKRVVRDSWFFKRAKQRKHLRGQHNDRKDLYGRHANWAIKRAKLREKLREKLRRAWHYIENTFATTSSKHNNNNNNNDKYLNVHQHHHQHHNQPDVENLRHTSSNEKHQKTTCRMDYNKQRQQQRPKSDNLRDEL